MIEVKPFQSLDEATHALDNGGRFYNLLTTTDDHQINAAELKKAAGIFLSEQKAFLYLHLALAELRPMDRSDVLALLTQGVAQRYEAKGPRLLKSSELVREGKPGELLVAEGAPRFMAQQTRKSIIMIPAGKVIVPVPVHERFDSYHLIDPADSGGEPATLVVQKSKSTDRLPETPMRFAGALRTISFDDPGGRVPGAFFEPLYFAHLD